MIDFTTIYSEKIKERTVSEMNKIVAASSCIVLEWRGILKKYGIKLTIVNKQTDCAALASLEEDSIRVFLCDPLDGHRINAYEFTCIIMHEIGHFLNFANKKFYFYHANGLSNLTDPKDIQRYKKTAFLAELYTDKVASKLYACLYPYPYIKQYSRKDRKYFLETLC